MRSRGQDERNAHQRSLSAGIYLSSFAGLLLVLAFHTVALGQAVHWPQQNPSHGALATGTPSPEEQMSLATLSGTVVSRDPEAASHTCLEVRDMTSLVSSVSVCTGPDGSFEVRDIPFGDYDVILHSGQLEVERMVRVSSRLTTVSLQLPDVGHPSTGGGASVSAAQLSVPGKAKHALEKAWHATKKNEIGEARKQIANALAAFPRYADALTLSAILDLRDNKPESSLSEAQQAVTCDQTNGMAYIVLAAAHNTLSHFPEALQAVEAGIRFRPDAWQGYFEKARAELGNRQYEPALADAARAEELNRGQTPVIHLLEGDALVHLARYQEAVTQLQLYLAVASNESTAQYGRRLLAEAQVGLGQP
jgi:hypothetical protein